jgi:hypothetical protein
MQDNEQICVKCKKIPEKFFNMKLLRGTVKVF